MQHILELDCIVFLQRQKTGTPCHHQHPKRPHPQNFQYIDVLLPLSHLYQIPLDHKGTCQIKKYNNNIHIYTSNEQTTLRHLSAQCLSQATAE